VAAIGCCNNQGMGIRGLMIRSPEGVLCCVCKRRVQYQLVCALASQLHQHYHLRCAPCNYIVHSMYAVLAGAAHGNYPANGDFDNATSGLPFTQLLLCTLKLDTADAIPFGTVAYFEPRYCTDVCCDVMWLGSKTGADMVCAMNGPAVTP